MQAVILAGGEGTRLNHMATHTPKPLAPVFDRPIIEHVIRQVARQDVRDIIVALPHTGGEIVDHLGDGSQWGVKLRYSMENEPRGTAGAVKLAREMLDGAFLVLPADIVTDFDLSPALTAHKSTSAMATILLSEVDEPADFGLVATDGDLKITRILEKPRSDEVFTNTASTGIYILEPDVLSCIPYEKHFDFACHLFPAMLNNGEAVFGFPIPGYWRDIGNEHDYRAAHFDALEGKVKLDIPAVHIGEGIWLGEGVDIDRSVELSSPVFVGAGSVIRRNAALGENTVIGAQCVVDAGARVARSIIGAGSHVCTNSEVRDCVVESGYRFVETEQPTVPVVERKSSEIKLAA